MKTTPLFSIIHPSARPDKWREIFDDWTRNADHPNQFEYVLCLDRRWSFTNEEIREAQTLGIVVIENTGRRCYVEAVNLAAKASTGIVLIVIADDQYSCEHWDQKLLYRRIPESSEKVGEYVIEVSTGTPNEHERGILVMPVLSRARYNAQGGVVFFHEYESMYADNDFCEWAQEDGVIIDARELVFPHRHWANGSRGVDRVDEAQNRREAYEIGEKLIARRRAQGFGSGNEKSQKPRISVCLPGESFSSTWVCYWTALLQYLLQHFEVNPPVFTFSSIVNHTRQAAVEQLLKQADRPDYVLWIDDDNPLSVNQFAKIYAELSTRSDVQAVSAWYFIGVNAHEIPPMVSAGSLDSESRSTPFGLQQVIDAASKSQMLQADYCGFGSVVMRMTAIEAIKQYHFRSLIGEQFQWGQSGEDVAFWSRFRDSGMKLLVDPRVKVPHLKLAAKEPKIEYITTKQAAERSLGKDPASLKICTIICAKNEGRWIARTVKSAKALGPVFVLNDGSTDDTREQAKASGAYVYESPYSKQERNEARDKNHILWCGIEKFQPDWVLYLDGDEELPLGAAEKIRQACASGQADSYAFGFVYLWNSPKTVRIDGFFGAFQVARLYSAANLEFCAPYENCAIHSIAKGKTPAAIDVQILHYGYMLPEDRIRKYEYYNRIDPHNEREDSYRHIVQGDVPEISADLKLKHAGPLDIRLLPDALKPESELQEATV